MSYEFQRTLDGNLLPVWKPSVRELLQRVSKESDDTTADIVRKAILIAPETEKFLRHDVPAAQTYDDAVSCFNEWLWSVQSFESFSRCGRKHRDDCESSDRQLPEWYILYLDTEHWTRVKTNCQHVNKNCVLCAASHGNFHTHHRTYLTLGRESECDVTLLCDRCHLRVHDFVRIPFPNGCSAPVAKILKREFNIQIGVHS